MASNLTGMPGGFGGGDLRAGEQFPNPFMDLASLAMPDQNRNVLEWCLPPGTLIESSDLSLTPVESVVPGLPVLTRGGTEEQVKRVGRRQVSEHLTVLTFGGLGSRLPLRLTGNHKVWRIRTARMKPGRLKFSHEQAVQVRADAVRVGDYFATPIPLVQHTTTPRFTGWLTGMYLAEGCEVANGELSAYASRFSLGADDERTGVLSHLVAESSRQVGYQQADYTPPTRPDVRLVTVSDPELPGWMTAHVGQYANAKHLSPALLTYGPQFILELLAGWIDGDGYVVQDRGHFKGAAGYTASKVLGYQLQRLANAIGLTPSLAEQVKHGFPDRSVSTLVYQLSFGKHDCQRLADVSVKLRQARQTFNDFVVRQSSPKTQFVADGYVYRKVIAVAQEAYSGPVYNLEVANDHSYIANGVTVSNCEFIFQQNGTYRMAMERIIAYFLTEIEIGSVGRDPVGDDEQDKYKQFLNHDMDAIQAIQSLDRDRMCYGNGFASVMVPFRRFLYCTKCGNQFAFRIVSTEQIFKFSWNNASYTFEATCPGCKHRGTWGVRDEPEKDEKKLKVKRWSPHEMEILHDEYSDDCHYLWKIPESYKRDIREGKLFQLERASLEVLKAVRTNSLFKFAPDVIYHMKEPTLAGIRNRGWGISRTLTNFRQVWYVQVLHRYNEAIALDYVIPFRLITPEPRASANGLTGDPLTSINAGDFTTQVRRMIRQRRRNPASWFTLPFPVQYQALGGDATQLAPRDLLDQGMESLLNAVGTPVDMYRGSMTMQSAPVALRLFESTWHHLVHDNNAFLRWLVGQVAEILSWDQVTAKLKSVTIADDMQKQMMLLQLMMGNVISQTTALKLMGVDYKDEQRRIAEEARFSQQQQAEVQEEMSQADFGMQMAKGQAPGAAPPAGGAPPPQGQPAQGGDPNAPAQPPGPVTGMLQNMSPNTPVTPQDMMEEADSLAQQLLGLPDSQKRSELMLLKKKNEMMWSLVSAKMKSIRNKARTSGGSQVLAQQFGGGGQ